MEILHLFEEHRRLLEFLFDAKAPRLSAASDEILAAARGLCSSDVLLVRVALDIWSAAGQAHMNEVIDADPETYDVILAAMAILAA